MPKKIPWIKNEAFDPHYEFVGPLDATEEELAAFNPDIETETEETDSSDPHVNPDCPII